MDGTQHIATSTSGADNTGAQQQLGNEAIHGAPQQNALQNLPLIALQPQPAVSEQKLNPGTAAQARRGGGAYVHANLGQSVRSERPVAPNNNTANQESNYSMDVCNQIGWGNLGTLQRSSTLMTHLVSDKLEIPIRIRHWTLEQNLLLTIKKQMMDLGRPRGMAQQVAQMICFRSRGWNANRPLNMPPFSASQVPTESYRGELGKNVSKRHSVHRRLGPRGALKMAQRKGSRGKES